MKRKKEKAPKTFSPLHALAYRFLGGAPAKRFAFSKKVRENLLKSSIKINHVVYISSMFFWSIIASILTFPISYFMFTLFLPLFEITLSTLFSIIFSLLASVMAGGVTFGVFMYFPHYRASNIKRRIEKDMVYTLNYMSILSSSGSTPEITFSSLARAGKIFGIDESAKSIMKSIELLGEDTVTALDHESKRTPSQDYADFLQGYIATTQTGGSRDAYLAVMAEKFMDSRKNKMAKMIEQLNLAGELFVAALVAFPIIMVSMLSIMGFFGGEVAGGLSAPQHMSLMTYGLIPVVAIGVLVFIDAIMSS